MKWLSLLAKRFVAGESAVDGVEAVRAVNKRGIRGILDYLGEDVTTPAAAAAAADEYVRLLKLIRQQNVDTQVSLKLSQMGLRISKEICMANLDRVLRVAMEQGNFVWLDMEGSALTQSTLDVFGEARSTFPNLGICLQAYLVRTGSDLDRLLRSLRSVVSERGLIGNRPPLAVRLCKGAYKEPPEISLPTRRAVEGNFRMLVHKMADRVGKDVLGGTGLFPAFATHDRHLIEFAVALLDERKIPRDDFEIQMLYGIENRYLEALVMRGYRGRVYIPYGTAWLPYLLRRLRERKENLLFFLRHLWRR